MAQPWAVLRDSCGSSWVAPESQNFYGVLELYNPDTRTFFTPVGELGISYHEMRYVSGLDYGEFVYEERIPPPSDLDNLSVRYGGLPTFIGKYSVTSEFVQMSTTTAVWDMRQGHGISSPR